MSRLKITTASLNPECKALHEAMMRGRRKSHVDKLLLWLQLHQYQAASNPASFLQLCQHNLNLGCS